MVGTAFWWTKEEAERDAEATGLPIVGLGPMTGAAPAEQHQAKPVAYRWEQLGGKGYMYGDELPVGVFTPWQELYVATDAGEVERLRDELEIVKNNDLKWRGLREQEAEIENLRTQLAERDALLREIRRKPGLFSGDFILRLDEILSANAEPSAPVECDERALIELALSEYGKATGNYVLPGGFNDKQDAFVQGFLCRAALERKP